MLPSLVRQWLLPATAKHESESFCVHCMGLLQPCQSETPPADSSWLLHGGTWKGCAFNSCTRQRQQTKANKFRTSVFGQLPWVQGSEKGWLGLLSLCSSAPSLNANIWATSVSHLHGTGSCWVGQTSWPLVYAALQDNPAFEINPFTFQEQACTHACISRQAEVCMHPAHLQASGFRLTDDFTYCHKPEALLMLFTCGKMWATVPMNRRAAIALCHRLQKLPEMCILVSLVSKGELLKHFHARAI